MSGSNGIGQLLKGVIMGVVLILAIIGSMSILEKNNINKNASTSTTNNNLSNSTSNPPLPSNIKAPEISIASQPTPNTTTSHSSVNTPTQSSKQQADTFQPVLEGEKENEENQADTLKYGILKISTLNPENKENLLANYVVFDSKNTKVAESTNSNNASYRLPTGTYRVVTTLIKSSDATTRNTAPVQSSKTITISANKLSNEVFELEPPPTIGVLQVSAINAKNSKSIKANFIVQKENGETVATRQNVTHSLFKLTADSYKVTVKSGNNSDFRTIVVEPGESSSEIFKLQEAFLQGKILVRVFQVNTNKPLPANIEISHANGQHIQSLRAVSQAEIALAEGNYKIKVIGSRGESSKNVAVIAGQSIKQIFQIDAPLTAIDTTNNSVQVTDNVKITGVETNNQKSDSIQVSQSVIKLFARNEGDQRPIKSNFYIQTLNGKNLAKKIYANSAEFKLKPGKYRVTVRAKNRKNIVKNIQIFENQSITKVFSLQRNIPVSITKKSPKPILTPQKIQKKPPVIPNGFLNVVMQPAKKTHFIITNNKGRKIVELTSVPSGNFKLDTGTYNVMAILNGQKHKKTIQVHQGKTSRLIFRAVDFQKKSATNRALPKGRLRSRIIDNNGRPLRGNLTVTNIRGQVIARANNVTFGVFDLPTVPHIISVNYKGLSGSERVNITAGKTTVQTFTITPNAPLNASSPTQQPRDANDVLRDKLKEELRRIF